MRKNKNYISMYITKETMEQQITEMWDAVSHLPAHNCDRDYAIEQARQIELTARETYRKQEQLRNAAPELFKRLKSAIYLIRNKQTGDNAFLQETEDLIKDIEK